MDCGICDVPLLIFSNTKRDSDIRYLAGCCIPDDIAIVFDGEKIFALSSALEVSRLRNFSKIDTVFNLEEIRKNFKNGKGTYTDVLASFLKKIGANSVFVKKNCQVGVVDGLRCSGIDVKISNISLLPQRAIKSETEIRSISDCAEITEKIFHEVRSILECSSISNNGDLVYDGEVLTSERLRKFMENRSFSLGAIAEDTIVACGQFACDPHNIGHGPIRAGELIVIDFFPYSRSTGYYSDVTRTFLKGHASNEQKALYNAVKHAHDISIDMVHDSAIPDDIIETVFDHFENCGFKTDIKSSIPCGMFHSLGHGIGLDIHERPSVRIGGDTIKSGMTMTIEPGLYYRDIGGVRVEDDVLVHPDGCEILTKIPYDFIIG